MPGSELPLLSSWQNFDVIIGTAAATLTGLMFVAVTLIAGIEGPQATLNAGLSAFSAPTVVHFCVVLLLAAIRRAPWDAYPSVAVLLGLVCLGLLAYLVAIMRQMRRVPDRQTPWKDWLWYMVLPLSAYIVLLAAALILLTQPALALFLVSAVMVALLFLGIHNAWDLVTYLAVERAHAGNRDRAQRFEPPSKSGHSHGRGRSRQP